MVGQCVQSADALHCHYQGVPAPLPQGCEVELVAHNGVLECHSHQENGHEHSWCPHSSRSLIQVGDVSRRVTIFLKRSAPQTHGSGQSRTKLIDFCGGFENGGKERKQWGKERAHGGRAFCVPGAGHRRRGRGCRVFAVAAVKLAGVGGGLLAGRSPSGLLVRETTHGRINVRNYRANLEADVVKHSKHGHSLGMAQYCK